METEPGTFKHSFSKSICVTKLVAWSGLHIWAFILLKITINVEAEIMPDSLSD